MSQDEDLYLIWLPEVLKYGLQRLFCLRGLYMPKHLAAPGNNRVLDLGTSTFTGSRAAVLFIAQVPRV